MPTIATQTGDRVPASRIQLVRSDATQVTLQTGRVVMLGDPVPSAIIRFLTDHVSGGVSEEDYLHEADPTPAFTLSVHGAFQALNPSLRVRPGIVRSVLHGAFCLGPVAKQRNVCKCCLRVAGKCRAASPASKTRNKRYMFSGLKWKNLELTKHTIAQLQA